jgi:haloacetate dehalogenase
MTDPATIHAMCEDYRAGASIDLQHDAADSDTQITCPLLVLSAQKGSMGRLYDVMAIWRERGTTVTGKPLPGGHNLQEDVPDLVLAEIQGLLNDYRLKGGSLRARLTVAPRPEVSRRGRRS